MILLHADHGPEPVSLVFILTLAATLVLAVVIVIRAWLDRRDDN